MTPRGAALCMAFLLIGCATAPISSGPPTSAEVAALEKLRILEPLSSPTRLKDRYVVDFAPTVETRGLACFRSGADSGYTCRFESRTREFFAREFGPWIARSELLTRDRRGRWRFSDKGPGP